MNKKVLIADDEMAIREGLKVIIPWEELGFDIIGEAKNGEEVLSEISEKNPDVVMIDLNMPKVHGIEAIRQAREDGFKGRFIILSGYSDFSYAQAAIRFGVTDYLTKPVDEDELTKVITRIKGEIEKEENKAGNISLIKTKARDTVITELITGAMTNEQALKDFDLVADCYQVVCYETYHTDRNATTYDLYELLTAVINSKELEHTEIEGKQVILLKSKDAVRRFDVFIDKYRSRSLEEDSPLDSIFSGYGRVVDSPEEIKVSFDEAMKLVARRFFCPKNLHTFGYMNLPELASGDHLVTKEEQEKITDSLAGFISAGNAAKTMETINRAEKVFMTSANSEAQIRLLVTDMLISMKEKLSRAYAECGEVFPNNAEMIEYVNNRFYLYEIFKYISDRSENAIRIIRSKNGASSTISDVVNYIEHNYEGDLTLENVAPLFGYNSVYFGKVFAKATGKSFNSYVNDVRLQVAKKLLTETNLKIYEISEKTGYNDVDYFSKKFRQTMGVSPAEFRKQLKNE